MTVGRLLVVAAEDFADLCLRPAGLALSLIRRGPNKQVIGYLGLHRVPLWLVRLN